MTDARLIAQSFRVTGHVQGVAFRAWTRGQAEGLGLAGWVRNRADGSVVGHAEGPEPQVEALISALFSGPGAAVVRDVQHQPVPVEGLRGFEIRR
jgi:acylphosphatase